MNFLKIRQGEKVKILRWWDVLALTVIMFSSFIYGSLSSFFVLSNQNTAELPVFDASVNWNALVFQSVLLAVAFLYLYFRNFDFAVWNIRINLKSIPAGIAIFVITALIMDVYFTLAYTVIPYPAMDMGMSYEASNVHPLLAKLQEIDISLLLYSCLNGFYEEIFFLGICLAVSKGKRVYYILYSLLIRYSFHTYQGNVSAVGIALCIGITYCLIYHKSKDKNLFPFFFAHAISDIFGVGIISYFL